ncbi:hypothetical protein M422DRAFT_238703 [Sphaerobolus stellatus SS14]|nr:hypothetical protein M422DRAFT_238703 [Sphaerobolus stellatus SS14]
MAARGEPNNAWSYTSNAPTWQGRPTVQTQGRAMNQEDAAWRGWQGPPASPAPHATFTDSTVRDIQRGEFEPLQASSTFSSYPPQEFQLNTLCMGNLEAWMDHEYASQVVRLMGWDRTPESLQTVPVIIKIPPAPTEIVPQPNNPGYCLLTFPTHAHAAHILSSIQAITNKNQSQPILMPNSSRRFNVQWATTAQLTLANCGPAYGAPSAQNGQVVTTSSYNNTSNGSQPAPPQKEYSIFVGDLAPETSNSDLVAVFRNPVLGLRNDREPKLIHPFYSCKSAKIMLDPVTGFSRGYGFVRFADKAEQQRALIEMHGLYCLSRPMRVSAATAKYKPITTVVPPVPTPSQPPNSLTQGIGMDRSDSSTRPNLIRSVSSPVAVTTPSISNGISTSPINTFMNNKDMLTGSISSAGNQQQIRDNSLQPDGQINPQVLAHIRNLAAEPSSNQHGHDERQHGHSYGGQTGSNNANNMGYSSAGNVGPSGNGMYSNDPWAHQAQARAILGNLIGPNGEQLTSSDPYNTTVFVGGLSPLISEETLRTFFAPFGDIHYVKVPLGKHCGFVQFVRKVDAEHAIDRMQGFPIGGSRIRLSWGRSQYKAAQAAAAAAQAAQAEQTARLTTALLNGQSPASLNITQEQAVQLLQSMGYASPPAVRPAARAGISPTQASYQNNTEVRFNNANTYGGGGNPELVNQYMPRELEQQRPQTQFSPFSPSTHIQTSLLPLDHSQQQSSATTPSPSMIVSQANRNFNAAYGTAAESAAATRLKSNSPQSSSSSGSSVRYAGLGMGGNAYGVGTATINQNGMFQANDLLRNDSPSLYPRVGPSSSPEARLNTPPRFQQQQTQQPQSRNAASQDHMRELSGTFSHLDIGGERYQRSAIGSEVFSKDPYEDRKPQSNNS